MRKLIKEYGVPVGFNGVHVSVYETETRSILLEVDCRGPVACVRGSMQVYARPEDYAETAHAFIKIFSNE